MKNPFRKSRLTFDTIRRINAQGLEPFVRVLIPLGHKRCIVLVTSSDQSVWKDSEGVERPVFKIAPYAAIDHLQATSPAWHEWVRCMGDDGKGCRASYADCICEDESQPEKPQPEKREPEQCGDVSEFGKVCVEPKGHTGVHKGVIDDLPQPVEKHDPWATVEEGGICPNPSNGERCSVCGTTGHECHADKVGNICDRCGKRFVDCECDFKAGHLTPRPQVEVRRITPAREVAALKAHVEHHQEYDERRSPELHSCPCGAGNQCNCTRPEHCVNCNRPHTEHSPLSHYCPGPNPTGWSTWEAKERT